MSDTSKYLKPGQDRELTEQENDDLQFRMYKLIAAQRRDVDVSARSEAQKAKAAEDAVDRRRNYLYNREEEKKMNARSAAARKQLGEKKLRKVRFKSTDRTKKSAKTQLGEILARRRSLTQKGEFEAGAGAGAGAGSTNATRALSKDGQYRITCLARRSHKACTVNDTCMWAPWSKYCYPASMKTEFGYAYNSGCGSTYCKEYYDWNQDGGCPLANMKCKDLKLVARDSGMTGYTKLRKAELLDELHQQLG